MPARRWPDGSAPRHSWRGAAARRLRELAERIDPALGPATGAVPVRGMGVPLRGVAGHGEHHTSRGLNVSGAPEHWARLVSDAGLAEPLGPPADVGALGAAPDSSAVMGHFAAVWHLGSRLWGGMVRALPGAAQAKSPTTADPGPADERTADPGPGDERPAQVPVGAARPAVPRLMLGHPQRRAPAEPATAPAEAPPVAGASTEAPRTTDQAAQSAPVLRIRPGRGEERADVVGAPSSPTNASLHAEPPVVRPALRASRVFEDAELASQRHASGVPQRATLPRQTAPSVQHSPPLPQTAPAPAPAPVAVPGTPAPTTPRPAAPGVPTQAAGAVVVRTEAARTEAARTEQPQQPQGHPSAVPDRPAAPPLTGTWPELAPRPAPGAQQTAPAGLETGMARTARLNDERLAV